MRATVVIPVHNGELFLRACLTALLAQEPAPHEVIAVENGSRDASGALIAAEFPQVQLIATETPLGFAGACNRGIAAALAAEPPPDVVVILNQDTVVDPGWLASLLRPLASDPQLGIVGSLARFPDGMIQHAGGALTRPLGYGYNLGLGTFTLPADLPAPEYMAALATAYRRELLDTVGWFDEAFFPAYFEDADLCLRARAAGWKIALAQEATLVHHEGAGGGEHHAAMIERNRLRLMLKHTTVADLLGARGAAERAYVQSRARAGDSRLLRRAYLHALTALPTIAAARNWDAAMCTRVADLLAELRLVATTRERVSRRYGLGVDIPHPRQERGVRGPQAPEEFLFSRADAAVVETVRRAVSTPPRWHADFVAGRRPPVSIILLSWNGLAVTQACIESLRANTRNVDYSIIVVDNGSSDGTCEWLAAQPDITLIANEQNVGYTRGNNQALAAVPPDHDVLLLNNDTLLIHEQWLAHLRDVANSHPTYGVVGCLLLHADGRLQHAGASMPTDTFWGYQIGGGERYIGQYPGVRAVESITGACMYIRADVRAAIGGLDEDFFSYFEDTDYCVRARNAGYTIVCTGGAQVLHLENTSSKLNRADWRTMFSTAQRTFLAKWRAHIESRYDSMVNWRGPSTGAGPYAQLTRALALALDTQAVDLRLAPPGADPFAEPDTGDPRIDQMRRRPADPTRPLVLCAPPNTIATAWGTLRIGYTLIDHEGAAAEIVAHTNDLDEVWVSDIWSAEALAGAGVDRPIQIVPPGVDRDYFHPAIVGRHPARRTVFLAIDAPGARPAIDFLLQAYRAAFTRRDDTLLLLVADDTGAAARILAANDRPGGAAITLLTPRALPAYQRGSIYRSADCFVLPHRGIAWGGTIREAMACGLPVIATNWGIAAELMPIGAALPLRVRGLVTKPGSSVRPEPDVEHLISLLRYVHAQPEEARAIGRAAALAASEWTWERAARTIRARLHEIGVMKEVR
jgi:hypothetical protein